MQGPLPLPDLAFLAAADPLGVQWGQVAVAVGVGLTGAALLGGYFWQRFGRQVRELQAAEDRYQTLFDHTAVPIIEEDFTEISRWLDKLRTAGVEDLQAYLKNHPEEMREQFQRIRPTGANRLGLELLGAEDLPHFAELMRLAGENAVPDTFPLELDALWFGRTSFACETTIRVPGKSMRRGRLLWAMITRRRGVPDPSRVLLTFTDLSELRASEERYERLFESLPIPAWLTDAKTGKFLDVNNAAVATYGWTRAEFLEMRADDIRPVDDIEAITQAMRHTAADSVSIVKHRMKDGRTLEAEVTSRTVEVEGTKAIMTMARDVTDTRRTEEALRASERRYRSLFEYAAEGVYESVPTGGFRSVNPAFARIFGFASCEELMGLPSESVTAMYVSPGRRDEFIGEIGSNDALIGFESEVRRRDGTPFWITENVRAVKDDAGRTLYFQGFVSDITDRKRAEMALREGEARYRTLFEQSPVAIVEFNYSPVRAFLDEIRAGGVTDLAKAFAERPELKARALKLVSVTGLNDASVRALGAKSKQQIMTQYEEILTEEAMAMALSTVTALWNGQNWIEGEMPLRRLDGSTRQFYWRWWMPLESTGPAFGNAQAALLDITDIRGTEAALRASEQRYRMLFEHSPIGIAEYDYRETIAWLEKLRASGVTDPAAWFEQNPAELSAAMFRMPMVGANAAMLRLIGAESLGEAAKLQTRLFTPEVFISRQAGFLSAWNGRNETEGEITLRSLDGTLRRVYHRWWVPVVDGRPYYERSQLAVLDLTEVKAAERTLAAERERLSVTLRAMTEGVITVGTQGLVEFINEAACDMTGWEESAAVGARIQDICAFRHMRTGVPVSPPVRQAVETDKAIDLPSLTQLVRRDGTTCLVEGRCAPVHDLTGHAVGAVLVLRDVTERSRLESELVRASKLESVGVLAGGIAHDFNNLLAIMMGNISIAMMNEKVMELAGKPLHEAEKGGRRARDLTQQLLTFAKGGEPLRSSIRIAEVVQEAAQFATHGANVKCEFDLPDQLLSADATRARSGRSSRTS